MTNFVSTPLNTGSTPLADNLYTDEVIAAASPTADHLRGTLVVRSGTFVEPSTAAAASHVSVLAGDVSHVTGTDTAVRVLYRGQVRADHLFLSAATVPVALTDQEIDALRSVGIYPISLQEINLP